ncbi:MAG: iron ABC transporter permease [Chloroflexi bacterium]|nr:iron ABC transporter permease [Chloroflexota bacterium]
MGPLRVAAVFRGSLMAVVAGIFGVAIVYPLARLLVAGFVTPTGVSVEPLLRLLGRPAVWNVLGQTLVVGLGGTAVAALVGLPLAWLFVKSDLPARRLLLIGLLVPLVIPPYIGAISWIQLLGPVGWLNRGFSALAGEKVVVWNVYGLDGVIVVLGLFHYPIVFLMSAFTLQRVPADLEEAARTNGASPWRTALRVTLPLAWPGIGAGLLLTFVGNVGNFGIPALIGSPERVTVLTTYLYQQVVSFGPAAFATVAWLATLSGAIAVTAVIALGRAVGHRSYAALSPTGASSPFPLGRWRYPVGAVALALILFTSIAPLLAMLTSSLLPAYGVDLTLSNLTMANYRYVLTEYSPTWRAVRTSFTLALLAATVCTGIGVAVAMANVRWHSYSAQLADRVATVPYALPGVVVALAAILAWYVPPPGWPFPIYGTIWLILLAYVARFSTVAIRSATAAYQQVDPTLEEAARVAGAGPVRTFARVTAPLVSGGLLAGALLVFFTALTELTVSALLWTSGIETIGVMIYNLETGAFGFQGTALASLVALTVGAGSLLTYLAGQALSADRLTNVDDERAS